MRLHPQVAEMVDGLLFYAGRIHPYQKVIFTARIDNPTYDLCSTVDSVTQQFTSRDRAPAARKPSRVSWLPSILRLDPDPNTDRWYWNNSLSIA
jgi:hypothetical protein